MSQTGGLLQPAAVVADKSLKLADLCTQVMNQPCRVRDADGGRHLCLGSTTMTYLRIQMRDIHNCKVPNRSNILSFE